MPNRHPAAVACHRHDQQVQHVAGLLDGRKDEVKALMLKVLIRQGPRLTLGSGLGNLTSSNTKLLVFNLKKCHDMLFQNGPRVSK